MSTQIPQVSKTLDDVRTEVFQRIEEVQDEYQAKGWLPGRLNLNKGVVRGLLEVYCWGIYQLYQLLETILTEAFPKLATDDAWVDLHADQVEAVRKQSTKALGVVTFSRSGIDGNVRIKAGTVVRTLADGNGERHRYATTADVVLLDGSTSVAALVESEDYGTAANATAGQIVELVTPVDGVEAVANASGWLTQEAADVETSAKLSERYTLAWQGSDGTNKYAYSAWALSVTGVVAVAILDQHPRGQGTVDVVVKGADGIPTESLLEDVREAIGGNTPINDDWLVKSPVAVSVALQGELELYEGVDSATAIAEAEIRLTALFTDPSKVSGVTPLQIGDDLTLDRLTALAMAVDGVKRVTWAAPTEDVAVDADGLAVLESMILTSSTADEA